MARGVLKVNLFIESDRKETCASCGIGKPEESARVDADFVEAVKRHILNRLQMRERPNITQPIPKAAMVTALKKLHAGKVREDGRVEIPSLDGHAVHSNETPEETSEIISFAEAGESASGRVGALVGGARRCRSVRSFRRPGTEWVRGQCTSDHLGSLPMMVGPAESWHVNAHLPESLTLVRSPDVHMDGHPACARASLQRSPREALSTRSGCFFHIPDRRVVLRWQVGTAPTPTDWPTQTPAHPPAWTLSDVRPVSGKRDREGGRQRCEAGLVPDRVCVRV
ncbi:activin beta B subunit precursor-like [Scleropages formosus]|uniref:Activin beta B subunit-like n=1 Tax=Scleropages formosus TaxID=113540 RepID=A0A0P7UPX0_SCLFO|nr:activin beta B subunit precursor-like [Scleropages formosus]